MARDNRHDEDIHALERSTADRREALVPASYAEKAMSSLLRLHEDLVEEKERRIDLYRRLMDREQNLAELKAYVRLLESELVRKGFDPNLLAIGTGPSAASVLANVSVPQPQPPAQQTAPQPPPAPEPPPAPAPQAPPVLYPQHSWSEPMVAWSPAHRGDKR